MIANRIVIGLDGGGTYTRALCADLAGNVLAQAQSGGANWSKNPDAEQNIHRAIHEVVHASGARLDQVAAVVAGIAGLDSPEDLDWAERFVALPGLPVKPQCVNDAVVAWAGALALQPGIVAIAGTGSIIFGMTEAGRQVRNYDFRHYSGLAARYLALSLVHQIVVGAAKSADAEFVAQVLRHFDVTTIAELAALASACHQLDNETFVRQYSSLAPLITQAASTVPLAQSVCDRAIEEMRVGIQLVGSQFENETIPVALIGGVAGSPYVVGRLKQVMATDGPKRYSVVEAMLPPAAGAVLMALERCGVAPTHEVIERLKQHIK
jgi:glucosamine kinase